MAGSPWLNNSKASQPHNTTTTTNNDVDPEGPMLRGTQPLPG